MFKMTKQGQESLYVFSIILMHEKHLHVELIQ